MSKWRKTDDWDKGECDECGDYRWHLFLYTNGESTLALCNGCGEALVTGEYTKAMEAEDAEGAEVGSRLRTDPNDWKTGR